MARKARDVKLVDLCRINTDAFRHMTTPQLKRVKNSVGSILDFGTKERDKRISLAINPERVRKLPERRSRFVNYLLATFTALVVPSKAMNRSRVMPFVKANPTQLRASDASRSSGDMHRLGYSWRVIALQLWAKAIDPAISKFYGWN